MESSISVLDPLPSVGEARAYKCGVILHEVMRSNRELELKLAEFCCGTGTDTKQQTYTTV